MPQTPRTKSPQAENREPSEKLDEIKALPDEQKKHDYYYDDAHGYLDYDPASDEDENDQKEKSE